MKKLKVTEGSTWSSNSAQGLPGPECKEDACSKKNNSREVHESAHQRNLNKTFYQAVAKLTLRALAFLLLSRPPIYLINFWLGILLISDVMGQGMDPLVDMILSYILSSDCLIIFGFLAFCCAYKPLMDITGKQKEKINEIYK